MIQVLGFIAYRSARRTAKVVKSSGSKSKSTSSEGMTVGQWVIFLALFAVMVVLVGAAISYTNAGR